MMQNCFLYAPNSAALSDVIVGNIIQRPRRPHHPVMMEIESSTKTTTSDSSGLQKVSTVKTSAPTNLLISRNRGKTFGPKRSRDIELDDVSEDALKTLKEVDPDAYYRERRRRNQERYRQRQRKMTTRLEIYNQQLRGEIEQLENRRNTLSYGVTTKETIWSVAAEYFRVFHRGLQTPSCELDFLRATMAPDMDAGTVVGLEALARNWRVFTEFFQGVQMQLGRLDQISDHSIVATITLHVTISRLTLHNIFPHLIIGKKVLSPIAKRLLGHRLVMPVNVRFDWDYVNNRVVSLISQGDMMTPMLQVLGNLKDVALVFSKSHVKPDGNLVVGDYLMQYTLSY